MENILIYLLIASKILTPLAFIYYLILILKFIKNYKAYKAYQYFMIGLIYLFLLTTASIITFKDIIFIKSGAEIEALQKLLK
jgi:hypothetical protein